MLFIIMVCLTVGLTAILSLVFSFMLLARVSLSFVTLCPFPPLESFHDTRPRQKMCHKWEDVGIIFTRPRPTPTTLHPAGGLTACRMAVSHILLHYINIVLLILY
jgi:hypothetical protein